MCQVPRTVQSRGASLDCVQLPTVEFCAELFAATGNEEAIKKALVAPTSQQAGR